MKKNVRLFLSLLLLVSCALLTVFSERASQYARDALNTCARSVIPSLFPYMVISAMLVSSNATEIIGKILPVSGIFNLPRQGSTAIILGAVCGFPVGARTAVSMYAEGMLTKEETEALIACSNNTGPSFVVGVIGASLFQSTVFGWQIYFSQLISSFIAAVLVNRILFPVKSISKDCAAGKNSPVNLFKAISDSVNSTLTVCGFICFFSVFIGFAGSVTKRLSPVLTAAVSSLLEFTSGASYSADIGGQAGKFFAGLSIGWSGISVFLQTASFTAPYKLSLKRCYAAKAIQGLLTGLLSIIPININATNEAVNLLSCKLFQNSPAMLVSILSLLLYLILIKKLISNHKL